MDRLDFYALSQLPAFVKMRDMKINIPKQITILFFERAAIAVLSSVIVIIVAILEIPTIDYPETSAFSSMVRINPWVDIFLPKIGFTTQFFCVIMVITFLISAAAYRLFGKKRGFLPINTVVNGIFQIIFLWMMISWIHWGLVCENESLRNADLFGCAFPDYTALHLLTGLVGSPAIGLFELQFFRIFQKDYLLKPVSL